MKSYERPSGRQSPCGQDLKRNINDDAAAAAVEMYGISTRRLRSVNQNDNLIEIVKVC